MASLTARLTNWLPPRLRMFVTRLSIVVVAWLATTGLIETVRSGDYPSPLHFAALIIGCAGGAILGPLPPASRNATG